MNKKNNIILVVLFSAVLAGCGGQTVKPDLPPSTIVRNQLVLVTPPEDFFAIPDNIPSLDTSKATQREVADWVTQNEKRTNELENKILELRNMFVKTYDLLKANSSNVIAIDTTKSDEFNKKTIEEANKKPVVLPPAPKTDDSFAPKDEGVMSTIKGWFTKTETPTAEPTTIKPAN